MASSISRYGRPITDIDRNIEGLIQKNTTPEEFDARCKDYDIELHKGESFNGYTPLMKAIFINMPLVEHIIRVGGKHLLDMIDKDGMNPMYFCLSIICNLPAVIKLAQLGADVNLSLRINRLSGEYTVLEKLVSDIESTPFKARYITLKVLLRHGAIYKGLSKKGKEIIAHAEREMTYPLISVFRTPNSPWIMPLNVAKLIANYVPKNEMPLIDEELEQVGQLYNEQICLSDHYFNTNRLLLRDHGFKMDYHSDTRSSVSSYGRPTTDIDRNIEGLIQKNTTPEEFDARCKDYGIELHKGESFNGYTPLMKAIFINMPLVEHIIRVGGKHLLDMIDKDGMNPMYFCLSIICNLPAVIKLAQLGADVNLSLRINRLSGEYTVLEKLVSDLESTPFKARYITLKVLLRHGAIYKGLSKKGKEIIAHAEREMRYSLISVFRTPNSPWIMPLNVAKLIANYVPKNEMPLIDEELEQVGQLCNEQICLSDHYFKGS